ncbi:fatty acid desaturase family protein [Aquisphaera insulae]|uniref:fatty acid desaturase family protein n=1 Tax=Aquisphaera insulae TaxID=2712864 RepID=UPI0013E9F8FB|nr:fatty acid desaturase [Aquisphaera insulae]
MSAAFSTSLKNPQPDAGDLTWDEVHHRLIPLLRADDITNVPYILGEYLGLAATLAACGWLYRSWSAGAIPTAAFGPLCALGMAVVAAFQHRLSGLGHEGSHYALFRNRLANELASDLFCMFPIMGMTQRFRVTHLAHHQFLNDPAKDPDISRLHFDEDRYPFPMSKRTFWYRYVLGSFWLPSLWTYLAGQAKNANVTAGFKEPRGVYRFRVGRCLRGSFWLPVLTAVHLTGSWPIFLLFWVAPLVTFYATFMQLREIAHHSNAPEGGEFRHSRNFFCAPIVRWAIFPYGQDYHLTHHVFGLMPHYNLKAAHEVLLRYPPYREQAIACHGYFFRRPGMPGPTILDVLSGSAEAAPA